MFLLGLKRCFEHGEIHTNIISMEQVSLNLLINVILINILRNCCKQNIPACTNFIECMYIHLKSLHEDIRASHALRNVRLKVTKEGSSIIGSNCSFLLRNLRQCSHSLVVWQNEYRMSNSCKLSLHS